MSNRRTTQDGTAVVACDMCGRDEVEDAYESFDHKTHVCYECVRLMYTAYWLEMRENERELQRDNQSNQDSRAR